MPRASKVTPFLIATFWLAQPTAAQQSAPEPAPPDAPAPEAPPNTAPPPPPPPAYVFPTGGEYTAEEGREFIYYPSPDPMAPHNEVEFIVGVPIWFTSEDDVIGPGVGFEGRFARRYGFIAPEFTVGWQINWLDEDELLLDDHADVTIDAFYFSLGARFYPIPYARSVTPFLSGSVDFDFWHISGNEDLVCGWYYCTTVAEYDFTFGLSGRLGLAISMGTAFQLELGAKLSMAFPMGPIDDTEAWVTPFVGFNAKM